MKLNYNFKERNTKFGKIKITRVSTKPMKEHEKSTTDSQSPLLHEYK